MRRILIGLFSFAWIVASTSAQASLNEAEFADIQATCSAEIASYDRANPAPDGQGAAAQIRRLIDETPDGTRALMGQPMSDREIFVVFVQSMRAANTGVLGPSYICGVDRRIAQIDGAPLIANAAKARPEPGPLGLQGTNPAQTGALAPDTEERYFLKGEMIQSDRAECGSFCPSGNGAKMIVHTSDIPGNRLVGGIFPGEFSFGAPMKNGTTWKLEIQSPQFGEFYQCGGAGSGTVSGNPRATNVAGAILAITITCQMTSDGRTEFERLRCDKERSDALLSREKPLHCPE